MDENYNQDIKIYIRFYMKNGKIKKCEYCNIMIHVNIEYISKLCNHKFKLYKNINDNIEYKIDVSFSNWLFENKNDIKNTLNNINMLLSAKTITIKSINNINIKKLFKKPLKI